MKTANFESYNSMKEIETYVKNWLNRNDMKLFKYAGHTTARLKLYGKTVLEMRFIESTEGEKVRAFLDEVTDKFGDERVFAYVD